MVKCKCCGNSFPPEHAAAPGEQGVCGYCTLRWGSSAEASSHKLFCQVLAMESELETLLERLHG